jgi:hypothetical protein
MLGFDPSTFCSPVSDCLPTELHGLAVGYHMHLVLYFGDLVRSSLEGVSAHINTYTESQFTANNKIDMSKCDMQCDILRIIA